MIGRRVLPAALWEQKNHAHLHVVGLPDDERIAHLCQTYAGFPPAQLAAGVAAIRQRLGGGRTMAASAAIHSGDFATACRIMLTYYDRTYQKCLTFCPLQHLTRHAFPQLDPRLIAAALLESTRPPP